jgi:hypothetical protein
LDGKEMTQGRKNIDVTAPILTAISFVILSFRCL